MRHQRNDNDIAAAAAKDDVDVDVDIIRRRVKISQLNFSCCNLKLNCITRYLFVMLFILLAKNKPDIVVVAGCWVNVCGEGREGYECFIINTYSKHIMYHCLLNLSFVISK